MTYSELTKAFRDHEKSEEKKHCLAQYNTTPEEHLVGRITFTQDSFTKPFSKDARTYIVSSNNKAYRPNMGGYSIYGSSVDGTDKYVRLEQYMADEYGGADGWKVEECCLVK